MPTNKTIFKIILVSILIDGIYNLYTGFSTIRLFPIIDTTNIFFISALGILGVGIAEIMGVVVLFNQKRFGFYLLYLAGLGLFLLEFDFISLHPAYSLQNLIYLIVLIYIIYHHLKNKVI